MDFSFDQVDSVYNKMLESSSSSLENSILIQALKNLRQEKSLSWDGLSLGTYNRSKKDYSNIFGYIYSFDYEGYSVYYVVLNKFQTEETLNKAYMDAKNVEEMSKILFAKKDLHAPVYSSRDKNKALVFLAKEALSAGFMADDFE